MMRNQQVIGSSPSAGSSLTRTMSAACALDRWSKCTAIISSPKTLRCIPVHFTRAPGT